MKRNKTSRLASFSLCYSKEEDGENEGVIVSPLEIFVQNDKVLLSFHIETSVYEEEDDNQTTPNVNTASVHDESEFILKILVPAAVCRDEAKRDREERQESYVRKGAQGQADRKTDR